MIHAMSEWFVTAPTGSKMTPADREMLMAVPTDPARGKHPFNSTGIDGTYKIQKVQVRSQILCLVYCTQKMKAVQPFSKYLFQTVL